MTENKQAAWLRMVETLKIAEECASQDKEPATFFGWDKSISGDWPVVACVPEQPVMQADFTDAQGQMVASVKPLERCESDEKLGWKIATSVLEDMEKEVRADGWETCLEVVQIVALSVEQRVLSAITLTPHAEAKREGMLEAADECERIGRLNAEHFLTRGRAETFIDAAAAIRAKAGEG